MFLGKEKKRPVKGSLTESLTGEQSSTTKAVVAEPPKSGSSFSALWKGITGATSENKNLPVILADDYGQLAGGSPPRKTK